MTPRDDKPIFRMAEKTRSRVADRPATKSGAKTPPDGIPGPGQSREEVTERTARGTRLTALRAGHALRVAALNLEGVARHATGTHHPGIMNNPAGRPAPGRIPPHVHIVVSDFDPVTGMSGVRPSGDPMPPLELERMVGSAPAPATVPVPSRPARTRLEPASMVQSRSPAEVQAMEREQALQAMQAARLVSRPLPALLPPLQQQVPLAPPPPLPPSSAQHRSPALSLSEQVRLLPDVPDEPVGGIARLPALPDVPGTPPRVVTLRL